MNQKDFTDYVVPRLRAAFPQIKQYQVEGHERAAYLEMDSNLQRLKILISTRNSELTIGFSPSPGMFSWHQHFYGDEPIDDKILAACRKINNILQNSQGIIYSSVLGPFPGKADDVEHVARYKQENETIEFKYWSDF